MTLSNTSDNQTLASHDNEVNVPVVAEVFGVSETDE